MKAKPIVWSVAIFTAREEPLELLATIKAAVAAATAPTVIDVLVNGNPSLAANISNKLVSGRVSEASSTIRVWSIALGGKAHAWNQYVQLIWPGSQLAFFIDGYARVQSDALYLLEQGMSQPASAIAGTGVPSTERTSVRLGRHTLEHGGLHGCFFALKAASMNQMRARNINLPLGLYGFDTLLGGMLGFGLDPCKNQWDVKKFIYVHPDVSWTIDRKKWWRYSVLKTHLNRILNNALRVLVIQATKDHMARRKLAPELIPKTVEEFVLTWARNNPYELKKTLQKSPLSRIALRRLSKPRDWSVAEKAPELIYSGHFSSGI